MRLNAPWPRSTRWYCSHGPAAFAPHAGERQPAVVQVDLEVLALETGQFGGDHVVFGRFVQIDRRRPAARARAQTGPRPLLDGEEIADGIPARERHGIDASTGLASR